MYKVIEEIKEIEEVVNTVIYEYDHESLESAMNHINLRNNQDCKCYIGSDDEKSKYRRSLMELEKDDLIEKLIDRNSEICGVRICARPNIYTDTEFLFGECDLYITNDGKSYEKISNVEVTIEQ